MSDISVFLYGFMPKTGVLYDCVQLSDRQYTAAIGDSMPPFEEKSRVLSALGGEPLLGSLSDIESLKRGADGADAVIHTAFGRGLGQSAAFAEAAREDRQAI